VAVYRTVEPRYTVCTGMLCNTTANQPMHFHSVTDSLLGVKVAQGQAAVLKYSAFVELREKERVVKPGVPISNNVRPFTTQESR